MPHGVPSVFLVEDVDDERFLAERALKRGGVQSLLHLPDGLQAKTFLETQVANEPARMPGIVLMDLKLPGMDGHQLLEWMASRPEFGALLCYVLSSLGNPQDRVRAERAQIAGYFVKPLTPDNIESLKGDFAQKLAGRAAQPGGTAAP